MDKESLHLLYLAVGGTAAVGKAFLMLARTMPPPPENCRFWCRWFHDFVQELAENQDKIGNSQDPAKPVGQAKQTISASSTTLDIPKGLDILAVSNKTANGAEEK
jgi:hypothetical protein